jgi:phosphomethylpyrimidine synthase
MNATEKFLAANAHVDEAAVQPLPNSRKIYIEGSRPDIQVPMREISQADIPTAFGGEKNPPILRLRLFRPLLRPGGEDRHPLRPAGLRAGWIAERGDTETLPDLSSEFGRARRRPGARRTALPRPAPQAAARQAGAERQPDALRPPRHHHPGDGIRRHPRKQQPPRLHRIAAVNRPKMGEKMAALLGRQHPGQNFGASIPKKSPRNSCAAKSPAAAPSSPTTSTTRSEPMIIGRNFLVKINANIGNSALGSSIRKKSRK